MTGSPARASKGLAVVFWLIALLTGLLARGASRSSRSRWICRSRCSCSTAFHPISSRPSCNDLGRAAAERRRLRGLVRVSAAWSRLAFGRHRSTTTLNRRCCSSIPAAAAAASMTEGEETEDKFGPPIFKPDDTVLVDIALPGDAGFNGQPINTQSQLRSSTVTNSPGRGGARHRLQSAGNVPVHAAAAAGSATTRRNSSWRRTINDLQEQPLRPLEELQADEKQRLTELVEAGPCPQSVPVSIVRGSCSFLECRALH